MVKDGEQQKIKKFDKEQKWGTTKKIIILTIIDKMATINLAWV
jgi:hypothetical protein